MNNEPIDFDKWLVRASGAGNLMVEPKEKSNAEKYMDACTSLGKTTSDYENMKKKDGPGGIKKLEQIDKLTKEIERLEPIKDIEELSVTTKKYLMGVWAGNRYGRRKDILNKYINKGLQVEEDSMTLYCRLKKDVHFKNEQFFKNDFVQGTPDIVYEEIVDLKSSWDLFTFLSKTIDETDPIYYWQGQVYMALTGAKVFRLAYCLIDTPPELIEQEKRKLMYSLGGDNFSENYLAGCDEIEKNMKFSDIPMNEKLIEIVIERNDEDIARLYARVEQCRAWLKEYDRIQQLRFNDNTAA